MAVTNSMTRDLTDADREAVEGLLMAFEQSWDAGALTAFVARLPPTGAVRFAALVEAVKVDLERSWQAGRRPEVEDYVRTFPELGPAAEAPTDLLQAEFEARRAAGDTLPLSALASRFPGRTEELRRLVGAESSTVETPNLGAAASTGLAAPGTGEAEALPEAVGPYRVVRRLGRGGMGAVYLAHDTRLGRPVALKVPRLAGLGADAVERFRREGRAAAALRHPNICPVYDVGEVNGAPFLAMAYVEGQTLAERARAGPLAPAEAAALVGTLARALAVAHKAGVVHRDLKPANVMVGPDGQPVVMDFGLARLGDGEADRLTGTGDVLGTPAYMAPEQVDRAAGPVGPATDVYGLGAVLYELLTGRPPFTGTLSETLWQIGCREPERPTTLCPDLDPRLEAITMKAMAKRPTDRYPTMDVFAGALDEYLASTTARPAPVNRVARHLPVADTVVEPAPRRPRSRRRWAVAAAAVLVVGTAGALIFGGRRGGDGPPPKGGDRPTTPVDSSRDKSGEGRSSIKLLAEPKFRATIGPTERSGWVGTRFWELAPDGHTLAYADRNSETVELWDAETPKKVATLPGHSRDVSEVAFSPDSRRVAVGSYKQVKVWDVRAAKQLYTILDHETRLTAVAFSADGKELFSVSRDGTALTTDADTGKVQKTGKVRTGSRLRFSPDRKTFALLGESPMEMYETATWKKKETAHDFSGYLQNARFTPDSKRLLAGPGEKVALYDLETNKVEPVHKLHTYYISSVDLSPDGNLVASGAQSPDKSVILWDLRAKKVRAQFPGFAVKPNGKLWVRFSPDGGTLLAWVDGSRSVRRFDVATGKELSPVGDFKAGIDNVFYCRDGKTLAILDDDGKLALHDVAE
jgi:serine/threonine protein kinase/WD40 repeat protein